MHRIDTPTAQKDKFGQGKNGFTNGDPATGRRATDLNSDMWDAVQEEVCTVIEAAGIPLSKGEHTQLHAAIDRLIAEQVKTRLEKIRMARTFRTKVYLCVISERFLPTVRLLQRTDWYHAARFPH